METVHIINNFTDLVDGTCCDCFALL